MILAAVVVTAAISGVSFVCGLNVGDVQAKRDYWKRDSDLTHQVLSRNPVYANVRIAPYHDHWWIILEGEVPTEDDKFRLSHDLTQAIGRERAEHAIGGVRTKTQPPSK